MVKRTSKHRFIAVPFPAVFLAFPGGWEAAAPPPNPPPTLPLPTAAVEACVLHGLKRRAAGFLRSNKIAALFMKVGKNFPPAEELSRKVQDLEQLIENA